VTPLQGFASSVVFRSQKNNSLRQLPAGCTTGSSVRKTAKINPLHIGID